MNAVDDEAAARVAAEVVAVGDAWAAAIVANDADRIADFMADEWVIVSASGVSPASEFLGLVRSGALTHSAFRRAGTARVRVYGDSAVLTARVANTAHHAGIDYDADEWTTDVFVRRDGRWRCVLSHITAADPGG
jgi:ketosteroid isomerase-like protein